MDVGMPATDGREARRRRTRYAIVDAWLDLAADGVVAPTARQVAERAGVGLRTVFSHFEDLDALALAASERQAERLLPQMAPVDTSLPLDERIRLVVAQRTALLEQIRPVRRAAKLLEPRSAQLAALLSEADAVLASLVRSAFQPELADLPPMEREQVAAALDVVCALPTWDHLRRRGLGTDDAGGVVERLLRGARAGVREGVR